MREEIFYGKHRSLELAERHLRELVRKYDADNGYIAARRNALRQFSYRGHYFTFVLEFIEEEEIEFGGAFDS